LRNSWRIISASWKAGQKARKPASPLIIAFRPHPSPGGAYFIFFFCLFCQLDSRDCSAPPGI
jgi:hypothetical protein